ncbi:hypothetical protein [Corynebacterium neomassiliense]|uniref:hypothetical protein n=1 Tax=Corynebacterium neomassiliense TaxID=2079482 RepID=UPI0010326FC0|nr:hypothetical protein [Corynebacterium neomassiliense]
MGRGGGSGTVNGGEESAVFVVNVPGDMRVIPFVVMLPLWVMVLAVREWSLVLVAAVVLVCLIGLLFFAVVRVRVGGGTVEITGPFYRRRFPVDHIGSVTVAPDDGMNHGLVNWPVIGRATSPEGVRLNLGGSAAVRVTTVTGERYTVVFPTDADALACRDAVAGMTAKPSHPVV